MLYYYYYYGSKSPAEKWVQIGIFKPELSLTAHRVLVVYLVYILAAFECSGICSVVISILPCGERCKYKI